VLVRELGPAWVLLWRPLHVLTQLVQAQARLPLQAAHADTLPRHHPYSYNAYATHDTRPKLSCIRDGLQASPRQRPATATGPPFPCSAFALKAVPAHQAMFDPLTLQLIGVCLCAKVEPSDLFTCNQHGTHQPWQEDCTVLAQ